MPFLELKEAATRPNIPPPNHVVTGSSARKKKTAIVANTERLYAAFVASKNTFFPTVPVQGTAQSRA